MRIRGITERQLETLQHIRAGNPDAAGEAIDFDQLLDLLSWMPSKEAAQFVVRALIKKELILKEPELTLRRGRKRVCYRLTEKGRELFDPRPPLPRDEESVTLLSRALPEVDDSSWKAGTLTLEEG